MSVEIHTALPKDAGALTRIAHAAKRHWQYPEAWIRLWATDLTVSAEFVRSHPVRCAVRDGELVAFHALCNEGKEFELEHMWVDPAHMGAGIGSALFRDAVALARARGGTLLRVASDPHAEGFYRAMGARPAGRVPTVPRGRTLPVLVYDLTSMEER